MIGKTISHYKILEKLGGGGMGMVYKTLDLKLDRFVALKFLPPSFSLDDESKQRFIHEAKAASSLQHNNICTIHEIDETDNGQLFICMDFYEGETLKKKIGSGPLKIEEAINIAIQTAEGLCKAHEKEIIHRDIKPANIFITNDGVVRILDFGLAKVTGQTQLTKMGSTIGTAAYMSPEQTRGEKVDYRTDIWSLGVVLYEMITGQAPFKGDYEQALVYSIVNEEPEPITGLRTGLPMELERIVNKVLSKHSDERYQHMDEMAVDLKSLKDHFKSIKSKQKPAKPKVTKLRLVSFLVGTAFLVAVIIVFLVLFLQGRNGEIQSIAVLPLENLSNDSEQEYFVDGMTEALISELAKISALRVISRTSIMQYKGVYKPISDIADELNVYAIVEGTVLQISDRVRISAQLIYAPEDKNLWANNYEG